MKNSKLCSFLTEKSCVLVDFKGKKFDCAKAKRKLYVGSSCFKEEDGYSNKQVVRLVFNTRG